LRLIDAESLASLDGSRPADVLQVWAWRDGSLVFPEPLQVVSASLADDAGDSVKVGQKLSLTVADPDGTLGAWRFDDPLGVAGTELRVIYRVGGAGAVNYGKFRIVSNEPSEVHDWRTIDEYGYVEPDSPLEPHKRRVAVTTAVVKLEAVDLSYNVDLDEFWSPQSPGGGATIITEIQRFTADYFPVVVSPGVVDRAVSRFMVYDGNKLEAVQDLAARIGARYRMGGDGEMEVYAPATVPVWRAEPSVSLVNVTRKQSIDGLYNVWVIEGKDYGDGRQVQAIVTQDSGPLRYNGPHGRKPYKYSSEMIETYAQAVEYGIKLRDEFQSSLAIELSVETIPRPELQAGDRIEVACPVAAGHLIYIPGTITGISRSFGAVPGGTSLTVQCSYSDVDAALTRTDWAQNLTGELPPLTWDRMPGSWGSLPAITWDNLPA
jgi:hypothetical protein